MLGIIIIGLPEVVQHTSPFELAQDASGPVHRQVVHRHDEVHNMCKMEGDVLGDDVFLIADQQGRHQFRMGP